MLPKEPNNKESVFQNDNRKIRRFFENCLNALFPKKCIVCFSEGAYLCKQHKKLTPNTRAPEQYNHLDQLFAITNYDDPVNKKLIEYFKFQGFKDIAATMAHEIVDKKSADFFRNAVLIPVPLHWTRKLWRGFNQAEVLTQALQKIVPSIEINTDLKRQKRTHQQAKLSRIDRFSNIADAFVWKGVENPPKKVLLVDDVTTTGATLEAAAKTLKQAGTKEVIAIVFAQGV